MTWVVCYQEEDRLGKKDASKVFVPESSLVHEALDAAGKSVVLVPVDRSWKPLWSALAGTSALEGLVYLGHGLPLGLPSLKLYGRRGARDFAVRLAASVAPERKDLRVTLFACSAADNPRKKGVQLDGPGTDGGFADELRDELCRQGQTECIVWAHPFSGHATRQPYLAAFEGRGSAIGGVGGTVPVRPKTALWPVLKRLLNDPSEAPSFRHRLPMMTVREFLGVVGAA